MVEVLVYSPMPLDSAKGNAVSARRIAALLRDGGIDAAATDDPDATTDAKALVVLNSWRSAAAAHNFRQRHPHRPLVAVLTGTDIYPDFPSHPEVVGALEAASAIVAWHDEARKQLPAALRAKTCVIYKSAPDIPAGLPRNRTLPGPPHAIEVMVIGHLREVKDPFRAAKAARLLPADSRIRIVHAGEALSAEMANCARDEMQRNPRYDWLGGIPRDDLFARLRHASLTVNSSLAEGGANAVVESLRCGVPILASRIPGNTGLLGSTWPGLFPPSDTAALATLLRRCEDEPGFYEILIARALEIALRFTPEQEREGWCGLMKALRAPE